MSAYHWLFTFPEHFEVIGYDVNPGRIDELNSGKDHTFEVDPSQLQQPNLSFTSNPEDLKRCTFIIIAVPTPLNKGLQPDLTAMIHSSQTVGSALQKGAMVVYESTVYPGVTEEVCLPILEEKSGLKLGEFDLGYSPERVNPGDKKHTVRNTIKVVSGHSDRALQRAVHVYGKIVEAGLHEAPNIKTAEAAKVIENVQRDLNIALMNELSKIFSRMDINTNDVLTAAGTKWNFHPYHPGLVGGHCIGVDPYYLTYRAMELGYHPEVILAGRRINDSMGYYVGELTVRGLVAAGALPRGANVWVLGMTFKEDVPDFRNSRATDVVDYLKGFGANITVWEPLVDASEIKRRFDLETVTFEQAKDMDAVVIVNAHKVFKSIDLAQLRSKMRTPVLVDVKNLFPRDEVQKYGFEHILL